MSNSKTKQPEVNGDQNIPTQMQELIAEADSAAKRRKAVPLTSLATLAKCPRKELVEQMRADGAIPSGAEPFFGNESKPLAIYINQGYRPVFDKVAKNQAQDKGAPLFWREKELKDDALNAAAVLSNRRMKTRKSTQEDVEGKPDNNQRLKVEEAEVKTGATAEEVLQ